MIEAGLVAEASGDHPVHMEAWGYTEGNRVDDTSPNSKGEHVNSGYFHAGIDMEGGGGDC